MLRLSLALTALLGVCFSRAPAAESADLIVTGAVIYTVDPAKPMARGIAVKGNRIVAVGDDVSAWIGPGTRRIDAKGRAVIPGFIDSHGHMAGLGSALIDLDLRGAASEAEVSAKVAQAAKSHKPGEWILGRAWDQNLFLPDRAFPTKRSLDIAAPGNPVYLTRVDGHAAWVNSRALELADVNAATTEPSGGKLLRDADGLTGVLIDNAKQLIASKIPGASLEQVESELEQAGKVCARLGLTTVHDAGIDRLTLEAYRALVAQHRLSVRVYAMIGLPGAAALWKEYQSKGPESGDFLTVRSLKIYADGALGSRGAALLEPYSDDPGNRGLLISQPDFIEKTAIEAARYGFQACTHAIGDRGNRIVLDAYSKALTPGNGKRFRIEHAQVVAPDDFVRFRDLSVIASMQPTHATSDSGWAEARLGPDRVKGAYAWQTFLKLGVHVPSGSDFPVEKPDPIPGFYAAISRNGWYPEQAMTREQALRSWTIEGAYAAFEEDRKGSITPGKLADFAVLSSDIMREPFDVVKKTRVVMTVLDGRVVFEE